MLLCVFALVAGCASQTTPQAAPATPAPAPIGRFASSNPGSVNTFWLPTAQGLVVVDAQRSLTDARSALAEIKRTGRPVAAILITHPHPDHVGGIGVLHEAFPKAPIYASQATVDFMRTDPLGFYKLTRSLPGSDYPPQLTIPDHIVAPNAPLDVAGIHLETAEFGPGEATTATAYYDPAGRTLFAGDLTADKATPALLEGNTCGWLTGLDQLHSRFPGAVTIYPGHGAPGTPAQLIDQQREYLHHFRRLVRAAIAAGSPSGATVTPEEQKSILDEVAKDYPGYPSVASLPTLAQENVKAVTRELTAENPATLPAACRD